jgi:predicted secreted protein
MYLSTQKRKWLLGALIGLGASLPMASAQVQPDTASHSHHPRQQRPQATLNAEASAVVAQDTVKITLASELTKASQVAVAQALSKTLESAMKDAKGDPKVKASSGNYRIWPVNDANGKISTWHGRGEILLDSTDFAAASALAAKLSDRMPIDNLAFSVSPQAQAKQEQALLTEAAQAFRERAQALTQAFGFSSYSIRSIALGGSGARYQPAPRMMAAMADRKSSVPLEGGTETVTLSVQGTIFLHSPRK